MDKRIEYGTDGQPYELSISTGLSVCNDGKSLCDEDKPSPRFGLYISHYEVEGIVEELENICQNAPEYVLELLSKIKNLPTINLGAIRANEIQRGYHRGYTYGMRIGKNLNPRINIGEWIRIKNDKYKFFCSKCQRVINTKPFEYPDKFPFCHCGAEMEWKEEGNENV